MDVFLVIQKGVYRQGIFGVFDSEAAAKSLADNLYETDADHYHDYQVIQLPLNVPLLRDVDEEFFKLYGHSTSADVPVYTADPDENYYTKTK